MFVWDTLAPHNTHDEINVCAVSFAKNKKNHSIRVETSNGQRERDRSNRAAVGCLTKRAAKGRAVVGLVGRRSLAQGL